MKIPADINKSLDDLSRRFSSHPQSSLMIISISEQKLYLIENKKVIEAYTISSAQKGTGNSSGSYQTPLGVHTISEKFGNNAELGSIFKARVNTHELATILTDKNETNSADNITSRILWLSGLERGINKGENIDSHNRYIYIHGTDEEGRLGQAVSHGCIRMSNLDVMELFDSVTVGTLVNIVEN